MTESEKPNQVAANKRALGSWIAAGWVSFFLILFITWSALPQGLTVGIATLQARLIFALAHIFAASLLLFLGFLAVGATRWQLETSDPTANPAISGGRAAGISVHNRVHTQFLSNTNEQFVMFSAALLAATPFLAQPYLRVITLVTILWIFGRLFFWGGYLYTAVHGLPTYPRAIGLGMGLLCTLGLAGIAAAGISLHYPTFAGVLDGASQGGAFLIQPDPAQAGGNLVPVVFFTLFTFAVAMLALVPKVAPPVVPMAAISVAGWLALLIWGVIPIR